MDYFEFLLLLHPKGSGDWNKSKRENGLQFNSANHVSSAMEEPNDLQPLAEETHVALKEEMELGQKSDDLVGNDRLASAEGATGTEKLTGVDSEIVNECVNKRLLSDQPPLMMHDAASEKLSEVERKDLNDLSHSNREFCRPELLASQISLFTDDGDGDDDHHSVEGSQNFPEPSSTNHLFSTNKSSRFADPHFSEQNLMNEQENSEERKVNGVSSLSSSTHPQLLAEGFQPSPVINQTGYEVKPEGGASAGTAEYSGACVVPVLTDSETLMLKSVCVSAAFPCDDDRDTEFEDDDKDLKNMVEELDRSAANALSIDAGKITLATREVRLGVSERAYSAGGAHTLLQDFSHSIMQIVSSFNI